MPGASNAVFLSYASEDAEAAERIATALRSAGVEVWFDKSELRGGDAWDQSIRKQIKTCALFLPVISHTTHDRREGYFRLEWKLAIDRSHLMDANLAFLLPVAIDDTRDDDERVPERFREVQWTRLPAGETPPVFVERVQRLLAGEASTAVRAPAVPGVGPPAAPTSWSRHALIVGAAVVIAGAVGYFAVVRPWISKPAAPTAALGAAPTAFAPPPHSIAVLPFVNMSGDKDQEYFSDGLTEEILDSLARINELQVAARTSSFSFQGQHPDIATVGHKLNVASVLEGSVRRSGHKIRVTAQLNNAVTGFHLWSQTYDRNLEDVLKLQTDIAHAVASALKVTLLGSAAEKIALGGTSDPAAFDAYLRASKTYQDFRGRRAEETLRSALALYDEALQHDPNYALALAERSIMLEGLAEVEFGKPPYHDLLSRAESDARRAIALTPDLAEGHLALAYCFAEQLDLARANTEYDRAMSLAPGNARVVRNYGIFAVLMGHTDAGVTAARHAVVIDPLNWKAYDALSFTMFLARRYEESLKAVRDAALLDPNDYDYADEGRAYYYLGEFEKARASCEQEIKPDSGREPCLAMVYDKLGRHADAAVILAKWQKAKGDTAALGYARIYAQWGQISKALEWLETAARLRDHDLVTLRASPSFDPLREEPRFQAVMRELKFPD